MTIQVELPGALRDYAGGRRRVGVDLPDAGPATLAALLHALGAAHPGVGHRVLDERGRLRPHVNVFVNGQSARHLAGLATRVAAGDEVCILPAVSGGT